VAHHATTLTLTSATRELEVEAVVAGCTAVSDGVVALTLRAGTERRLPNGSPALTSA
jgi:hypothetical protein